MRGRGTVKLRGRTYDLLPGRLFSYGPGIPHHITGDPNEPLVKYFVDFAGIEAINLLNACKLTSGRISKVASPRRCNRSSMKSSMWDYKRVLRKVL